MHIILNKNKFDESSAQARRNLDVWVLVKTCYKFMHLTTLHKREWLSMLFCINKTRESLPNFYIFRCKYFFQNFYIFRCKYFFQNFIERCEIKTTMAI
jgi:hypothetical protein